MPVDGSDREYIVGANRTAILIDWDGTSPKARKVRDLFSIPNGLSTVLAGPTGNLYVGSYGPTYCAEPPIYPLYQYTSCGCIAQVADDFIGITGTAIDKKRNIFYVIDACSKLLTSFKWDAKTGKLCRFNMHIHKIAFFLCAMNTMFLFLFFTCLNVI